MRVRFLTSCVLWALASTLVAGNSLAADDEEDELMNAPSGALDDDDDDEDSEDEDEEEDDSDEDEPDDRAEFVKNRPGSELFQVELGPQIIGRYFDYTDSVANTINLRPYSVFGPPAVYVAGVVYPAATLDIPVLSDLGVSASYMHAFVLSSEDSQGRSFSTLHNHFTAGLRYRYRLGKREDNPIVLGAEGQFGMLAFELSPDDDAATAIAPEVATASYTYLRAGLFARIPLGEVVALLPRGGYIGALNSGEVYERFRSYNIGGVDMGLMVAAHFGDGFEARLGGEYTRFFSAFQPEPGDEYVAGGALDHMIALRASGVYIF